MNFCDILLFTKEANEKMKRENNRGNTSDFKITKNMTIGQVIKLNSNLTKVLEGFGLHCLGCPMSQMETLEEASEVHGVDIDFMIEKLNENLK